MHPCQPGIKPGPQKLEGLDCPGVMRRHERSDLRTQRRRVRNDPIWLHGHCSPPESCRPDLSTVLARTLCLPSTLCLTSTQGSARYVDDLAGHKASALADQERDDVGDVFGLAHPADRDAGSAGLLELVEVNADPRRGRGGHLGDDE